MSAFFVVLQGLIQLLLLMIPKDLACRLVIRLNLGHSPLKLTHFCPWVGQLEQWLSYKHQRGHVSVPLSMGVGVAEIDDAKAAATARTIAEEKRIMSEDVTATQAQKERKMTAKMITSRKIELIETENYSESLPNRFRLYHRSPLLQINKWKITRSASTQACHMIDHIHCFEPLPILAEGGKKYMQIASKYGLEWLIRNSRKNGEPRLGAGTRDGADAIKEVRTAASELREA
ncbi:uncharacterized protein HD556DRAFT_1314403 [Suillus plorans]|uniref:Uncharacterized protein n=1 Tax=Suillus plorans TaxID=116603 RepID=A0A9P7AA94_9AGAM|nr:uncharacterized protein HD556DRAFT_1314403 [Suillus plorans]KAG1785288.1 hypothetical protein HD556DRAFT_1314403 [Suillus plorans]